MTVLSPRRSSGNLDQIDKMQVSSSKENRAAEIDQCLRLLSPASSDESKFTALLILPRLLDATDHSTIQHVFDKMNFKFIERLMKSSMLT
jgi:hypothetical protein